MPNGYLRVQVMSAQDAKPVPEAMVRVYKDIDKEIVHETFYITDSMGVTPYIPLYAPDVDLSLEEDNRARPYETYNVEIRRNGYETLEVVGVQIFADDYTNLPVNLVPMDVETTRNTVRRVNYVQDHQLLTDATTHSGQIYPPISRLQSSVIIPKQITVHLGSPTSNAENVTVDFIYYLKNVASSELYPTWEEEALKANILAQISLALNRIYTEWYPSKGYDFDITNSTAYDQAFVKNRNIYDNISLLVDDLFNQYIQKDDFSEPFYAEYCDGKIANCPGMKQWGSQSLALSGYDYLEILKYYYGDDIKIVTSNNIQDIQQSYAGIPLRLGSTGLDVREIQEQLNAISINYPRIQPIFPLNGVFGTETEDAVKVFQRQFSLPVDGVVGKATWYKISYIYAAVRKLAELGSIGDRDDVFNGQYPGTPVRVNDVGIEVQLLQYYLSVISTYDDDIKGIPRIDGHFGNATRESVVSFQRKYNLNTDGVVGEITWNKIYEVFKQYEGNVTNNIKLPAYPDTAYRLGSNGADVVKIQEALNVVGTMYPFIPVLVTDGTFGPDTDTAVRNLQGIAGIPMDGIVGPETWNALFTLSYEIQQGDAPSLGLAPYPGAEITLGSRGEDVQLLQDRLRTIAVYYRSIPNVALDGIYGPSTQAAVVAFQELIGLPQTGIVNEETWYKIEEVYRQLTS